VAKAGGSAARADDEIEAALRAVGTPARAESEKRYLKSDLAFLGATVWQTRDVVKAYATSADLGHDDLIDLVEALWAQPIFERRMASTLLLELHPKLVSADDLLLLERLIR
jgi:hypothetical protein